MELQLPTTSKACVASLFLPEAQWTRPNGSASMTNFVISFKVTNFFLKKKFNLNFVNWVNWNRSAVTLALTVLTSSQAILIVWSKRAGKYEYSVTTANFSVRTEAENVTFFFK